MKNIHSIHPDQHIEFTNSYGKKFDRIIVRLTDSSVFYKMTMNDGSISKYELRESLATFNNYMNKFNPKFL